jgi:hypothetical protein
VWQFKFECCPQVQEIIYVVYQLSCFVIGFLLFLVTGGLFLCLTPFPWGQVSDPSAGCLLSACCDGLLFVFQFFRAIWLWLLLTGLRDELCGMLPALLQAVAYPQTAVSLPAFPAICLLIVPVEISSLPFSPSLVHFQHFWPPHLCASFQFIVYCSIFFCRVGGQSAQGAMLVYPRHDWGYLVLSCLAYQMSPKQVWSQSLAAAVAHLFSQYNVVWRCFVQARSSGCWSFDSPWCFNPAKCGSSISARFLIHGAHAVCFCTLVAILDPPQLSHSLI